MTIPDAFLNWSKNGIGPKDWFQLLAQHYRNLATVYQKKELPEEAELFANVAEEFNQLEQKIKELSLKQNS